MGNSKPGIVIQTEKPFYLPGEVVNGCVYVHIPHSNPISKITLNILGVEKTWYKGEKPNSKKNSHDEAPSQNQFPFRGGIKPDQMHMQIPPTRDRYGECKIIEANFLLYNWGQSPNLHGQFAFPFEFRLPNFVPGSFKEESLSYKASIVYEICCTCVSSKRPEDNIVFKQELIVREPKKKAEQHLFGEVYLYPKTCWCISKGISRVCCYFQKNQYVQGEDCIAICEVDNSKCKVPMKEIKVKLKKAITLTSQFGEEETIIKEINKAAFPGVPAFQHYGGQFTQKLSLPLKDKHSKTPLQPSTNGRLVKCHYFLQITPEMRGCFTKKLTSFQVGLNILPQGLSVPIIEQPENWNPQFFKKSQIILSPNYNNQLVNQMGNQIGNQMGYPSLY